MTVNRAMELLTEDLEAEGVGAPLCQTFSLAALWNDLARIAGGVTERGGVGGGLRHSSTPRRLGRDTEERIAEWNW